jgi:flagellar basal-body rod modification protein FlgD
MTVNNISSALASSAASANRTSLAKNDFLMLLVTQLKNQDPLSPLQPHEFAAQLAQFTSVEQLQELNAGVARQEESLAMATLLSKTSFSAALLGRKVVAAGDRVVIPASGSTQVKVEIGGAGGRAKLRLFDTSGREVATRELGALPPGRQTLTLPGDLSAGTYRYQIEVKGADDKAVNVTTYTTGIVDGISFLDGRIVLKIGTLEIALDDLAEIEPGATAATAAGEAPTTPSDMTKEPELSPIPKRKPIGDLSRALGIS